MSEAIKIIGNYILALVLSALAALEDSWLMATAKAGSFSRKL
jgi:hypothetical protein